MTKTLPNFFQTAACAGEWACGHCRDGGDKGRGFRATIAASHSGIPSPDFDCPKGKPLGGVEALVTFGITSFRRPEALARLTRSIKHFYPRARIVVADNGDVQEEPLGVDYHVLPFDCGLSASRNFILKQTKTPFLLQMEEDFVLTETSKVERLLDVLTSDPEVGLAGGSLRDPESGVVDDYCCDFDIFRRKLYINPGRGPWRSTPSGTPYRPCDQTFNFYLARTELLQEVMWPEELPLGEHFEFYLRLKEYGQWRAAHVPSVVADHERLLGRTDAYNEKRGRAIHLLRIALRARGLDDAGPIQHPSLNWKAGRACPTPNIIVLGVGHSGTSALTKILHALGWRAGDADGTYAESEAVRAVNEEGWRRGIIDGEKAGEALSQLPRPWAMKDPRLIHTLNLWLAHLLAAYGEPPSLLWVVRDPSLVDASYRKRGERTRFGMAAKQLEAEAQKQFDLWPGPKAKVHYDDVTKAASLWRPT